MNQKIRTLFDKNNIRQTLLNTAFLLFVFSLLYKFIEQLFSYYGCESWQISEYLINYQGGFVRRGLSGEILFFFARNFNIDIEWTIKIFCLICFIAVSVFFIRAFLKKGYTLYILPLCFFLSAGTVFLPYWIRKDYLLLCFFIPIIWIYSKDNLPMLLKLLLINIMAIFIILCHEVFAFFSLPVLLLMLFNQYKNKGTVRGAVLSFLSLSPCIIVFLLTLLAHGNYETAQSIWLSWSAFFSRETAQTNNAISALGWSTTDTFLRQFKLNFLYTDQELLSLLVWMISFPVIYYIVTNALLVFRKNEKVFTNEDKTVLSSVLIFQFLCLLPVLVILSCDYIRIIFYWIASSFALFLLIPKDNIQKSIPVAFTKIVDRFNQFLTTIFRPSKTSLVFLMMFVGISSCYCVVEWIYKSTMLYNLLWIVSKPLIYLKTIIFTLYDII